MCFPTPLSGMFSFLFCPDSSVSCTPSLLVSSSVADPDPFDTDPDPAFLFDADPDPYSFKEVMYLKQYFLYIFT